MGMSTGGEAPGHPVADLHKRHATGRRVFRVFVEDGRSGGSHVGAIPPVPGEPRNLSRDRRPGITAATHETRPAQCADIRPLWGEQRHDPNHPRWLRSYV
ncbi:hypothetical protein FRACA_4090004 [Frankia canadensis]|uniref:Uncharacterized protein n=1 Tax=Frankia canadensis TaxID=1836972 RepID=A0A2I2KWV4_9ACTN|nr:hypothetical protein FRACA_4090004 [Frankia canadensis]SOU57416.1 hypothetical protein FRACA_4090004 [Frankia canadensis]